MSRFDGQTVVVTGASRGLGRAIATAFGAEGAQVYLNFKTREDEALRTQQQVQDAGGVATLLPFDVGDRAATDAAVDQVLDEQGQLDVWINNAAVAADGPFPFMDAEAFTRVLEINLVGVFHGCQAASRPMLSQRRGAIINIGSVAGSHASPGQANYAAAKGGVLALTRTLAAELAPRGIRVNAVIPGLLDTGLAARLDHRIAEKARSRIPLARFGSGKEAAAAATFLASADASYIIGQALVVDGGLTL